VSAPVGERWMWCVAVINIDRVAICFLLGRYYAAKKGT
jgi:hypothetical protein